LLPQRLAADPLTRPALVGADPVAELPELARRREPWYRAVAHRIIAVGRASPAEIALRLASELEQDH
jgi:shikimate kinase